MRAVALSALLSLIGAAVNPVLADDSIGTVQKVRRIAYGGAPDTAPMPIHVKDNVVAQSLLKTVEDSAVQIRFADRSQLTLGADGLIVID